MVMDASEVRKVKDHLLGQLGNFPEDRREEIRKQVESMSASQVEDFVKQNQLTHLGDQCILCAIGARQIDSFVVGEDDENIAVLEINPLSKGHSLLFSKSHTAGLSPKSKKLGEFVAHKLSTHFYPKRIDSKNAKIMGHPVVEIIPVYDSELKRRQASPEELAAVVEGLSQKVSEVSAGVDGQYKKPVKNDGSSRGVDKKGNVVKVKPRIP